MHLPPMKKRKTPTATPASDLKALRKEMDALKTEVAKLRKAAEDAKKPGKIRATSVVVDSIQVVDASGTLVAEIDGKGNLFCRTVWANSGKRGRGVFIDGARNRKIVAGTLELIGLEGNKPGVRATCSSNGGLLTVQSTEKESHKKVVLQGSGAALMAYGHQAKSSRAGATLSVAKSGGGSIHLTSTDAGNKGGAILRSTHVTGEGALFLKDAKGKIVGKLP